MDKTRQYGWSKSEADSKSSKWRTPWMDVGSSCPSQGLKQFVRPLAALAAVPNSAIAWTHREWIWGIQTPPACRVSLSPSWVGCRRRQWPIRLKKLYCCWIVVASLGHIAPPKSSQAESQGSGTQSSNLLHTHQPSHLAALSPQHTWGVPQGLSSRQGPWVATLCLIWMASEGTCWTRRAQLKYGNTSVHLRPPHGFPTVWAHDPFNARFY